jgi:hypothetical protein
VIKRKDTIGPATASAHIVCADLILAGYRAMLASEGLPYDVVLDTGDRLYRIQVKCTSKAVNRYGRKSNPVLLYYFLTTRNHRPEIHGGKADVRHYDESEIDILACVALDIKTVAYFRLSGRFSCTILLYPPGTPPWLRGGVNQRRAIDAFPISTALSDKFVPTTVARTSGGNIKNTSGHVGVYWFKPQKSWKAQMQVNGKFMHLGYFKTKEEAIAARQAAGEKYQKTFVYQGAPLPMVLT